MGTLVTLTLNPALDLSTEVAAVVPEHKLRCDKAIREPGGGGINVARVAARLGADARAVILSGGSIGEQLLALTLAEGIDAIPIPIAGETRQSFSIAETSTGQQFRFVFPGPALDQDTVDRVAKVLRAETAMRCLVISGSMPPGTPSGTVAALVDGLSGVDVIVDTSGPELVAALQTDAMLVKPSARELSSVVDRELNTDADVRAAAEEVVADSTIGALLVSIGPGGAILARRGEPCLRIRPPTVQVRSAVGAGDSMVGGLATGLGQGLDLASAAALGVAAGTAAVMTTGSNLCSAERVEQLRPLVTFT